MNEPKEALVRIAEGEIQVELTGPWMAGDVRRLVPVMMIEIQKHARDERQARKQEASVPEAEDAPETGEEECQAKTTEAT